jgi:hypothetical protein
LVVHDISSIGFKINVAAQLSKIIGKQNENRRLHDDYGQKSRPGAADMSWRPLPGNQFSFSPDREKDHSDFGIP